MSMHATGAWVCFRLDEDHQSSLKTCSQPGRENDSCLPPCLDIGGSSTGKLAPSMHACSMPLLIGKNNNCTACKSLMQRNLNRSWLPTVNIVCVCISYVLCVASICLKQLASITPWLAIAQAVMVICVGVRRAIFHQTAVSVIQPTSTYPIADVSHSNLYIILAAITIM